MRFAEAYREAVDWMYSDPKAMEAYAAKVKASVDVVKQSISEFQPKETMQTDEMKDMDGIVRDAVKLKFLDKPLTKEEVAEFVQIPSRKK